MHEKTTLPFAVFSCTGWHHAPPRVIYFTPFLDEGESILHAHILHTIKVFYLLTLPSLPRCWVVTSKLTFFTGCVCVFWWCMKKRHCLFFLHHHPRCCHVPHGVVRFGLNFAEVQQQNVSGGAWKNTLLPITESYIGYSFDMFKVLFITHEAA